MQKIHFLLLKKMQKKTKCPALLRCDLKHVSSADSPEPGIAHWQMIGQGLFFPLICLSLCLQTLHGGGSWALSVFFHFFNNKKMVVAFFIKLI